MRAARLNINGWLWQPHFATNLIPTPPKIHAPIWWRTSFKTRRMRNFNNPRKSETPPANAKWILWPDSIWADSCAMEKSLGRQEDLQLYEIYAWLVILMASAWQCHTDIGAQKSGRKWSRAGHLAKLLIECAARTSESPPRKTFSQKTGRAWGRDHGFVIIPLGPILPRPNFSNHQLLLPHSRWQIYWIHCFWNPALFARLLVILTGKTRVSRCGMWVHFKQKYRILPFHEQRLSERVGWM